MKHYTIICILISISDRYQFQYHYNQLSGFDSKPEYIGVLAQDIKSIAPYMVGSFQKKGGTYYNVDNSAMTYMLINAVKEQQLMIDKQQQQIECAG